MIEIIFPIPIGVYERPVVSSPEEIDFVKSTHYKKNLLNLMGSNNQLLNEPELANIKQFIEKSVAEYATEAYRVTTKFKITLSWSNLTTPNQSHHEHFHPNSIFSGTYYFEDIKDSPIVFLNPNANRDMTLYNEEGYLDYNLFNAPSWAMNHIKAHTCLIFPSWMKHSVGTNVSGTNRYSIAFNTFFDEGQTIGKNHDLTEIKF